MFVNYINRTDKLSEAAILQVVKKNFEDHLILGEEGGIIGEAASDYLWCIDPLGQGFQSVLPFVPMF